MDVGQIVLYTFVAVLATLVTAASVRWVDRGRLTDEQIGAALAASGASTEETATFTRALRDRITQLRRVCGPIKNAGGPLVEEAAVRATR